MPRLPASWTGKDIASVDFILDGHEQLSKRVPPFSVELDLGSLPRMRTLTAIARDELGAEVARDQKEINAGSHRFDARLIEPRSNKKYERSLRAEAEIEVPDGGAVERVEFYLNETLVATLYQEPWTQPIFLDTDGELAYVRVVAYRPDGNYVEDTVFVNAPDYMENLEVQFVELYITVLDKQNHPVLGLEEGDFVVLEDEQEQEIRRFDRVTNLPIHAAILLDISASMEESLEMAQRAALEFFQDNLTPKDRAALMTFNDHPNLVVKFTNELSDLAGGLAGLKAERGTALYDSVVFSLFYFNGIKGQRALIILSDGKDEHSRFSDEDTLEYARRAGVAIYSVGLGLNRKSGDAKKNLTRLAEETGGRSFFVDSAGDLPAIYAAIQEELRSRYYMAYQSTNTADDEAFRTIQVNLRDRDLEATTLRGYYP
jgi:Ca-activated chloride channel homolog